MDSRLEPKHIVKIIIIKLMIMTNSKLAKWQNGKMTKWQNENSQMAK